MMRPPPSPPPSAARRSAKSKSGSAPYSSKQRLKRGPWTPEEDELLSNCVTKEGEGRWRTLPKRAGLLRCGKSCRLRWMNYLRPDVKRGHIAPDEEDLIIRLHRLLGNRWSLIAGRIPGRTDNEIKNYWNTHISKKLISQGIDPRTHKPLSPSIDHHLLQQQQHHNHIASSSATAMESEQQQTWSSNRILPPVPKVNWSFNWAVTQEEEEEAAAAAATADGNVNLQEDCQVVPGFGNIIGDGEKEKDEDDGFNYACTDEGFSSFLNSLINEDVLFFNDMGAAAATTTVTPSTADSDTNNNNNLLSAAAPPSSTQNDPPHELS